MQFINVSKFIEMYALNKNLQIFVYQLYLKKAVQKSRIDLEVLAWAIREENEIKGIHIGKEEVKVSVFSGTMIFHVENPKESTKKLVELISKYNKISEYKNQCYFYAVVMNHLNVKKIIPLTIA